MYLSKILLDPMHPSARQALRDRQDMHRNVLRFFPDDGLQESVLYRVVETKYEIQLIVLSNSQPDADRILSFGGKLSSTSDISSLPDLYKEGAVLRFSLLACPSKKVAAADGGNSRRVLIREPGKMAEWLSRQGQKYGFSVLECNEPSAAQRLRIGRKSGGVDLNAIDLSGVLRIDDAALFWVSWRKGIGPEKAYGLGLMLLSR